MIFRNLEQKCKKLLAEADIHVNGDNPWDIQVSNPGIYQRVVRQGSLGLAEAYMDGWCDCSDWEGFFKRGFQHKLREKSRNWRTALGLGVSFAADLIRNPQSKEKSKEVAEKHYDLGNEFYEHMLDPEFMQYTCGYWDGVDNLDDAQKKKLEIICRKIHIEPGMSVLELGSGWGGLARYIAKNHKCQVVSFNISKEQVRYAQKKCSDEGLPVIIIPSDYRNAVNLGTKFDRVVSVGLMEHVGHKNYETFFKVISRCLEDDRLAFVHTIGKPKPDRHKDPFIAKYIFPGGELPCFSEIIRPAEKAGLVLQDVQNIGQYYARTLGAWHERFSNNWEKIQELNREKYNERFRRMFGVMYLQGCKAAFEAGNLQLWQMVFTKGGAKEIYKGVR